MHFYFSFTSVEILLAIGISPEVRDLAHDRGPSPFLFLSPSRARARAHALEVVSFLAIDFLRTISICKIINCSRYYFSIIQFFINAQSKLLYLLMEKLPLLDRLFGVRLRGL